MSYSNKFPSSVNHVNEMKYGIILYRMSMVSADCLGIIWDVWLYLCMRFPILKCHWNEEFLLVSLLFRTYESPLKKRSRDRSLWRKKLCCNSTVIGKMADSKKKTVFVESFRGRNWWKNMLHEWFLNTEHIVSCFPQKIVSSRRSGWNLCRNGSVDFKAPTACPALCSWQFWECLFNWPPFLEVHTVRAKLKKSS